ncbi:MAG TPA: hypothetical protein EYP43_00735 [Thermoplasmata archaeon]|nr:hypothetical protein [Thermoplasmata archaeon]
MENFWLDHADYDDGDMRDEYSYADSDKPYIYPPAVAERTRYVVIVASTLGLVSLGLLVAYLRGRRFLDLRILSFLLLATVLVSLVAPLYFMAAFPKSWESEYERRDEIPSPYDEKFDTPEIPMFHDKFSGTIKHEKGSPKNRTVETIEWGGGLGWMFAVIGGILILLGVASMYKYRHEVLDIPRSPYEGTEAPVEIVALE